MPILILLILVVLIAQIGFWDTLAAVLGGIGVLVLLVVLAGLLVLLTGFYVFRKLRS